VAYINSDSISLFGSQNVLQDMSSMLPQEVWADMPESVTKSGITWKGKKLFVPTGLYGDSALANTNLLGELGYKPDTTTFTWQDILDIGAKAKPKSLFATSVSTVNWESFVQTVWQAGGNIFSDDVTKVQLDQQPAHDALTFWVSLFQGGFVPKEGALGSEQEGSVAAVDYFYTNKQVVSGLADAVYTTQTVKQAPNLKFSILTPLKNKQQLGLSNSDGWGIFNKSKNTDATVTWVDFLMEPQNLGFYCSVAGEDPSRNAAQAFWIADPNAKNFTTITRPFWHTNQDANYFWQEAKTTTAPHFQAAVLGKAPVEQALADATKELQKIVDAFWAKLK
jgi:multiple sugar transport system substrate-binding protein